MFIIDADALIHAFRYDFPPAGSQTAFWDWLDNVVSQHVGVVVPQSVIEEISKGNDGLHNLVSTLKHVTKEPTAACLQHITAVMKAYGKLTDIDLETIARKADPYIVAHAIQLNATVVTNEIPAPNRLAANRKIPDICSALHVPCIRYPRFLWDMRGLYR